MIKHHLLFNSHRHRYIRYHPSGKREPHISSHLWCTILPDTESNTIDRLIVVKHIISSVGYDAVHNDAVWESISARCRKVSHTHPIINIPPILDYIHLRHPRPSGNGSRHPRPARHRHRHLMEHTSQPRSRFHPNYARVSPTPYRGIHHCPPVGSYTFSHR